MFKLQRKENATLTRAESWPWLPIEARALECGDISVFFIGLILTKSSQGTRVDSTIDARTDNAEQGKFLLNPQLRYI